MSSYRLGKTVLHILVLSLTVVLFVPTGAYLQWALPVDLPPVCACLHRWTGIPILLLAWVLCHKRHAQRETRRTTEIITNCLFVFLALVLVTTSIPALSRRVGPWATLRGILVETSRQAAETRAALALPKGRHLTPAEMHTIEQIVLPPAYTFPIIHRTVHVRMMSREPPYVGVDYGDGRRAVFNLTTMAVIYAD